jgi:hypothetical protein
MKLRTLHTFRNPCWLAFYISLGILAVGYLGLRASLYLSQHFPEQHPRNMDFFGGVGFLLIPSYCLFFAGIVCSVIFGIWLLAAAVIYLFRRKHPKHV